MAKTRKRHALSTRIWHWINAASIVILFMSGLNIANAHRRLYWGNDGYNPAMAWFTHERFPGWATIPDYYSLAAARDWHVLFTLVFGFSFLAFIFAAIINGHLVRDLFARAKEWRWSSIRADIAAHFKLNFEHGAGKYNILQKIAYAFVIFIAIPMMIFTGMVMSPGMEAAWPWMTDLFGGRQSARSLHFIFAFVLMGFLAVHLVLVLLAGQVGQIRDMITGGRAP